MNLAELRSEVRGYLNEPFAVLWTDAELNQKINVAQPIIYNRIKSVSRYHFTTRATFQTMVGGEFYQLPKDMKDLKFVTRYNSEGREIPVSQAPPDAFGADHIRFIGTTDTSVPTNGTATTEQLTSDHASMVACALVRTSNAIPSIDLTQNSETECEYVVEVESDATDGDTYDFRLYSQTGTALSAYTVTPRITVQRVASGGR